VINRLRAGYDRRYTKLFRAVLNKQITPVLKSIDESGLMNTLEKFNELMSEDMIAKAYIKLYKDVGLRFAKITNRSVKSDAWMEDVLSRLAFVSDPVRTRIVSVAETSRGEALKIIQGVLDEGMTEGLGIPEISSNIRKTLPDAWKVASKFRAQRIAQTEVVSASNFGSIQGAKATGLPVNKVWLTGGANIRDEHLMAEGESVPIGQKFIRTGEDMDFPGDPTGSAWNVINCKCAIAYETL